MYKQQVTLKGKGYGVMKKITVLILVVLVIFTLLSACSQTKSPDISGTYVNLDEKDVTHSYTFTPDPENAQSGSYTLIEDFTYFLDDGDVFESAGGWSLNGNTLIMYDSRILELQELTKALGGDTSDEYEGSVFYVFDDYIINAEGCIEPSIEKAKTFDITAECGRYTYSFTQDGTVLRRYSNSNSQSLSGTYTRKNNIITCNFPDDSSSATLVVYEGKLYKSNYVFHKE